MYNIKNKWPLFIALGFMLTCSLDSLHAQYPSYKAVTDMGAFKKKFAAESAKVNTVSSNFTQEKTLTALTEKIVSHGKFSFKRSNRVRIEYTRPYSYLLVMNGDKMKVKDDKKETQVNVRSNKLFQQINRIMIDCVQGTILDSKDFTSRAFENDKGYLLEMKPKTKALGQYFDTIVLQVEKKDYAPTSIEMNEVGGDKTLIRFADKKINAPLQDALFAL